MTIEELGKAYLFLLRHLPSKDGGGGVVAIPFPPTFFTVNIFEIFFIDTWVSDQR